MAVPRKRATTTEDREKRSSARFFLPFFRLEATVKAEVLSYEGELSVDMRTCEESPLDRRIVLPA